MIVDSMSFSKSHSFLLEMIGDKSELTRETALEQSSKLRFIDEVLKMLLVDEGEQGHKVRSRGVGNIL